MSVNNHPKISVIVPVHNRADLLAKCLDSIYSQKHSSFETLVIDDGSTVDLKPVVKKYPIRYFRLKENRGPAFARNFGVTQARGNIVIFIDSDVIANNDILERIKKAFDTNKGIAAVQGNYTITPYYNDFFSNFRNITWYYYFSILKGYSNSIATFCTAIRKDIFLASGGFDQRIKKASIEDEEFGIQLTRKGHKILFDNNLQVKHMKKFTFYSLMRHDFRTGFEKIKSLLRKNNLLDRHELHGSHFSFSLLASIPLSSLIFLNIILLLFTQPNMLIVTLLALLGVFFLLNFGYFHFIMKVKKSLFFLYAFIYSLIDYFVIQIWIISGIIHYLLGNKY